MANDAMNIPRRKRGLTLLLATLALLIGILPVVTLTAPTVRAYRAGQPLFGGAMPLPVLLMDLLCVGLSLYLLDAFLTAGRTELTSTGVSQRGLWRRRELRWAQVRRVYLNGSLVVLEGAETLVQVNPQSFTAPAEAVDYIRQQVPLTVLGDPAA